MQWMSSVGFPKKRIILQLKCRHGCCLIVVIFLIKQNILNINILLNNNHYCKIIKNYYEIIYKINVFTSH